MPEIQEEVKSKKADFNLNQEEMMKAGLHFGHRTSKHHPNMAPFISGVRNSIHIIDLEKTVEKFEKALQFIQKLVTENQTLLLVGTKIQAKKLVKDFAQDLSLPYVNERWLGGTLSNFETIQKRVRYFKELEKKKETGELEKYTKKERVGFNRELRNLELKFGGLKNLNSPPDAIFVLDMEKDAIAVREAKEKGIKIIGISDTNINPGLADFPIPANDDALTSLEYILKKTKEAILKARQERGNKKQETKTEGS